MPRARRARGRHHHASPSPSLNPNPSPSLNPNPNPNPDPDPNPTPNSVQSRCRAGAEPVQSACSCCSQARYLSAVEPSAVLRALASISVTSLGGGDPGLRPCSGETRTAAISRRLARMHARERGDLVRLRLRLGLRLRARARAGVRVGMGMRSGVRSRRRHVKQRQRVGHLPLVAHPRLHAIPPPVVRAWA